MKQIQIPEKLKEVQEKLKVFLDKFSARTKRIGIIAIIVIVVAAVVLAFVLNNTGYAVLYSEVTSEEATEILSLLSDMGIEYKYDGNGNIMVEEGVADSTRATLAYEGYPKSGFTYDVYIDNVGGMTTDSETQTYKIYDLQDRLGATIKLFDGVKDARVTIALGSEQKYVLDDSTSESSASVVVIMKSGYTMSEQQAEGIQRLVAHSVSGMDMKNVSVLDESGVAISSSGDSSTSGDVAEEIAQIVEGQITKKVWNVLEPFYGADNIRISTNVEINMENIIRESITYTTPDKIDEEDKSGIVSNESLDTEAVGGGTTSGGVVGTEENSDISQYVSDALNSDGGTYSSSIDRDYLVNQVKEQGELAAGAVEDKTVSVSLNASAQDVLDLDELRDLIGAAAGIDSADRAEKISIVIAPFYSQEEEILVDGITAILQSKYFPFIAIGCGVLLILLIVIIIVVAKAKKKAKLAKEEEEAAAAMTLGQELSDDEKQEILNMKNERSRDLRESVREFTDANPEIAAHMIKDWLHGGEDSGED